MGNSKDDPASDESFGSAGSNELDESGNWSIDPNEDGVVTEALRKMDEQPLDPRVLDYLLRGYQSMGRNILEKIGSSNGEFSDAGLALSAALNSGNEFKNRKFFFGFGRKTMIHLLYKKNRSADALSKNAGLEAIQEGECEDAANISIEQHQAYHQALHAGLNMALSESYLQKNYSALSIDLQEALSEFSEYYPDQAVTLSLRILGHEINEIAEQRDISRDRVNRHIRMYRSFFKKRMAH